MKRTISMLLVAVSLVTTQSFAQEPAVEHAPKIACDQPTYNFGEMENSKDVEHTFVLRNEGDLTLEISRARPSCGCTVANLSQNSVPPGGECQVTAKLSLRGRQGQQHKVITVESNDPKQPALMLALEGTALAGMQALPNQIFFGRITSASVVTGVIEVAIQGTNPVNITKSSCDAATLSVSAEKKPDSTGYRVSVSTIPPLPRGTFRANVHIETDSTKYPVMDIPVSAFVVGDVSFAPEEIVLVEDPNQIMTRYVIVRSETGRQFEITSVEPPLPSISTGVVAMDQGGGGFRIEIRNITPTKELDGKVLHIRTSLETSPDVTIPFRVLPSQAPAPTVPVPSPAQAGSLPQPPSR